MKQRNPISNSTDNLRKRAESLLREVDRTIGESLPDMDTQELFEELRIHQIELEMQNEELRSAYGFLEKVKELYADLYEFAPVGYVTLDKNYLINRVNTYGAELLGFEKNRLLGTRLTRFFLPDMADRLVHHLRQCLETRQKQTCELKLKRDDEHPLYVQLESVVFAGDEKKLDQIRLIMIDITDRIKADEKIKVLSRELLISQEKERQMISCELHDRIAQELSLAKLKCDILVHNHVEIPEEVKQELSISSKILQNVILAVRDLSYQLRPPELDKIDITECLSNFCGQVTKKQGVKTDFFSAGMESLKLDDIYKINIYRIVQEGITNIFKHANATRVNVTLSYSHPNIILRITDNGKGFDVEKRRAQLTSEKRMGLRSIQERVGLLGGTMEIWSKPKEGTKISIKIPYRKKSDG